MVRNNHVELTENYFTLTANTGFIHRSDIETIKNYVKKTGGATVLKKGRKMGRYVVGLQGIETSKVEALNLRFGAFVDVIQKTASLLKGDGFGIWIDSDNKIYFDVIKTFDNESDAIRTAKENNELAIFDIKTDTAINV